MSASLLPIIAVLVFLSALLSASEVALFSLSRFQLRFLRENFQKTYARIRQLLSDPSGVLLSILVLNEVANVGLSTLIATEVNRRDGDAVWWEVALKGVGISLPVMILLCEVTPKVLGAKLNQVLAPLVGGFLLFVYRVMGPLRHLAGALRLVKRGDPGAHATRETVGESDFMTMVEQGHREGNIHTSEFSLIRRVFDLDDTKAAEIMTPVAQLTLVAADMRISDVATSMERQKLFRVPVYKDSRTKIVGILYAKDILECLASGGAAPKKASELAREPFCVQQDARINHIFRQMRLNQTHMAVVLDSKRRAVGVLTMTDILGELFEDLSGESSD